MQDTAHHAGREDATGVTRKRQVRVVAERRGASVGMHVAASRPKVCVCGCGRRASVEPQWLASGYRLFALKCRQIRERKEQEPTATKRSRDTQRRPVRCADSCTGVHDERLLQEMRKTVEGGVSAGDHNVLCCRGVASRIE